MTPQTRVSTVLIIYLIKAEHVPILLLTKSVTVFLLFEKFPNVATSISDASVVNWVTVAIFVVASMTIQNKMLMKQM